jgi:prepilin-type N-terminal cleavage/methylation domain-containing protein
MQSFAPGRSARSARARRAPAAFTLLELLIAIAIIGILASLILTVAGSAQAKARTAQVSVDIQDLSKGIAAFKQRFGVEPPSRVTLYEQAAGWQNDPRSMGLIRQIWPQFDFTYAAYPNNQIDINGDGFFDGDGFTNTTTGAIYLTGSECLVFFLGGVPASIPNIASGGAYPDHYFNQPPTPAGAPAGFSSNPADPFGVQTTGTGNSQTRTLVGTNRERFTEFNASRLLLLRAPVTPTAQPHTMNAYLDTLPGQKMPYLYFSSYGGQGYDVANELPAGPAGSQTFTDVYRQGPNGFTSASPSPAWNANSFQIISPGFDGGTDAYGGYGIGGQYDPNTAATVLVGPSPTGRGPERDNITNFSSGTLAP